MEKKMNVNTGDLETMLTGMATMCQGLWNEALSYTSKGVLSSNKDRTEGENAVEWIRSYYDMVSGTIRIMTGVLNTISTGLANEELEIIIKE